MWKGENNDLEVHKACRFCPSLGRRISPVLLAKAMVVIYLLWNHQCPGMNWSNYVEKIKHSTILQLRAGGQERLIMWLFGEIFSER